jgi:hypothetical protein
MIPSSSYDVRMGCRNCGRDRMVFTIPQRRVIDNYYGPDEADDPQISGYHKLNGDDYHILICPTCSLPQLYVQMWEVDSELQEVRL